MSDDRPAEPRADAAPTTSQSVMDCGPGGCGGGGGFGAGGAGGFGSWFGGPLITPGLDRVSIDDLCSDALMWRIVSAVVDDALAVRPTLAGESGELTSCLEWLEERGFWEAMRMALIYSRQYGGGGIVCIVDDGRPPDDEVDPLACRDVVGFYALPKWYLVPYGSGSSRVRAGWYGPRIGRPEWYSVTPNTGFDGLPANVEAADRMAAEAMQRAGIPHAEAARQEGNIRTLMSQGGSRWHRSRVIPWPHRDDMDLRLARWIAPWNGWGPGVVEGCAHAFMARRQGALRIAAIMRSIIVNTVTMSDLEHRQSTPDLGGAVRQRIEHIKWCLQHTDDALPFIATDTSNVFGSHTHSVAGVDKLVQEQRQFLLDVVDLPAVRLYGDSAGGLNGGSRDGEWRSWYGTVKSYEETSVWSAGAFGGGLKQAVSLAMLCSRGPTGGRLDKTVRATWPSQWRESAKDAAETGLKHAQRRAQDKLTLGLTSAALMRHDPTVQEQYPSLDLDESPLPTLVPGTEADIGAPTPSTTPAIAPGGQSADDPQEAAATTPGAVNKAVAAEGQEGAAPGAAPTDAPAEPAEPAEPATMPLDIHTEGELASALKMTRPAVRRLIEEAGIQPFVRAGKGARGGDRYELGKVLAAWQAQAQSRADAMRG